MSSFFFFQCLIFLLQSSSPGSEAATNASESSSSEDTKSDKTESQHGECETARKHDHAYSGVTIYCFFSLNYLLHKESMESGGTMEDDDESSCGESQSEDIESEDVTSTPNSSESQTVSQWNIFKSQ